MDLKNDSEGIPQEEKYLEIYRWNIWAIFLERTWGGLLGKYLGSISKKNSRVITGEIFVGYFEEDFGENIDHYNLFVDINSQTNSLRKFQDLNFWDATDLSHLKWISSSRFGLEGLWV
jgi:hypothetical protein